MTLERRSGEPGAGLVGREGSRIRALLTRLSLGLLRSFLRGRAQAPVPATPPRKILVMQLQQVGDSVIFTPALAAIHRRWPHAVIDVLASPASAQLYSRFPWVGRVVVDPHSTSRASRKLPERSVIRALRRERYDVVVADVAQHSLRYGLIAWLTGAPVRIGFDVEGRGLFYTHRITCPPGTDYLRCNLLAAAAIGADVADAREELHYDASDREHADALLRDAGVDPSRPLVLMHPASNWQSKTWFEDRWARLADALALDGVEVGFVGTPAEAEYVEIIRRSMTAPSISLAGATSLTQLAALLDRCDLFVGTDSGPRHIAGALGRPMVTVMSSQDLAFRWSLARPNETVIRTDPECSPCFQPTCSHRTCMDLIDAARVVAACRSRLGRDLAASPMA